ncbi:MAG TPA: SpoIIE family protein phosphatase, partial [Anaerovoracaceae bacterium]|nr:SpoIIE family protein phosphatase [Anaerovoracaceae bacterium]
KELIETVRKISEDAPLFFKKQSFGEHFLFNQSSGQPVENSWKLLENILKITSEAIIGLNQDQSICFFSAGSESVFGYSYIEAIGQHIDFFLPESSHGLVKDYLEDLRINDKIVQFTDHNRILFARRKNGEIFQAQVLVSRSQVGIDHIFTLIFKDLSSHINIEERLKKLSVVVEQTQATVLITDIHGIIEYVNPAFENITGYKSEEVIGSNPRILKSGLMSEELYKEMWGTITSGKVWQGELCNRKKNGEFYWDLGTVSPLLNKDGKITNFIAVKEDITAHKKNEEELDHYRHYLESLVETRTAELVAEINERKRKEETLKEKERRLTVAQKIGKLGSWEWKPQTNEIIWSDESYRILGISPSDIVMTYADAITMVHPDDRELVENALNRTLLTGQPLNIEHRFVLPDGQYRIIDLKATPIAENSNDITKVIGTVQDITERVRIENELLEKERLTHELVLGKSIQLSLLPKIYPSIPGWQFAAFYQPANQVGGDFYDFIALPDGRIGLVIADVAGKGVPAALLMSSGRAIIRTIAPTELGPASTLLRTSRILYEDNSDGEFVTAFYACLDPRSGRLDFANAGHNRPLWYSSMSGEISEIYAKGIALGVIPDASITEETIEISIGDLLIMYTDGLVESQNTFEEFYGLNRLKKIIHANKQKSAKAALNAIVRSWQKFNGNNSQSDDLTIIIVKRTKLLKEI